MHPNALSTTTMRACRARPDAAALAGTAVWALRAEAQLTPKPGLVDGRGTGAHRDMDLALLLRSASVLQPTFSRLAGCAAQTPFGPALRRRLAAIGRDGESCMLAATGGINTHRGAIWALGLLVAAAATPGLRRFDAAELCRYAGRIARLPLAASLRPSHGQQVFLRYGARGARGEAEAGFPHVIAIALPALQAARRRQMDEAQARLSALLALLATVEDTCVLYRGGRAALAALQDGAAEVLAAGLDTDPGQARLAALDRTLLALGVSPGGCADLLAATLLLDRIVPALESAHGNA